MNISESEFKNATESAYRRGFDQGSSRINAVKEWRNGLILGSVGAMVICAVVAHLIG